MPKASNRLTKQISISGGSSDKNQASEKSGESGPPVAGSKRSRSGCMTCRLRRKRCDQGKPDCDACQRLSLKCMGYGYRRPEWMKNQAKLEQARREIREFLAQRSKSRISPETLSSRTNFLPNACSEVGSEESPTTDPQSTVQTQTPESNQYSSEQMPLFAMDTLNSNNSTNLFPTEVENEFDAAVNKDSPPIDNQEMFKYPFPDSFYPSTSLTGFPYTDPTTEMLTNIPVGNDNVLAYGDPFLQFVTSDFLQLPVRFSPPSSHHPSPTQTPGPPLNFVNGNEYDNVKVSANVTQQQQQHTRQSAMQIPTEYLNYGAEQPWRTLLRPDSHEESELITDYFIHVFPLQFVFIGPEIINLVVESLTASPALRNAVCSLSALRKSKLQALREGKTLADHLNEKGEGTHSTMYHLKAVAALYQDLVTGANDRADTVWMCLHLISYVLFSGGVSNWRQHLQVALTVLERSTKEQESTVQHHITWNGSKDFSGNEEFSYQSKSNYKKDSGQDDVNDSIEEPFELGPSYGRAAVSLTRVVIWFDIMGSVSIGESPRFMRHYRKVRSGKRTYSNLVGMEKMMGCSYETLYTMAETVCLDEWKRHEMKRGTLNVFTLAQRGQELLNMLDAECDRSSDLNGNEKNGFGSWGINDEDIGDRRRSADIGGDPGEEDEEEKVLATPEMVTEATSECFRHAARIYIHAVVSGSRANVPEIFNAVDAAMSSLSRITRMTISTLPDVTLERRVIFPMTMIGCHAISPQHRNFFRERAKALTLEASFGNLGRSLQLMEEVWLKVDHSEPGVEVSWRDTQTDLGWPDCLLLV